MPRLLKGASILTLPEGRRVPLEIRVDPRASYLRVTISDHCPGVELVLPRAADLVPGIAFAQSKSRWIERSLAAFPDPVPFEEGAVIPFLGRKLTIRRHRESGFVLCVGEELWVPGSPSELALRVRRWLEAEARREIVWRVAADCARIGASYRRLLISDTRSRWGCCSPEGDLQFSWRLVMAPEPVLAYVVAHEVAHLRELNHGRRFWHHVRRLAGDVSLAQQWLRDHGAELHRYGRPQALLTSAA
jgi:predicted metal-dependent hydrolase